MTIQNSPIDVHWPTKPGRPGFHLVKDKSSGLFYFTLNDPAGKLLLSSKGSGNEMSFKTILPKIQQLVAQRFPVKKQKDGQRYYFMVEDQDGNTLLRSRFFDLSNEMDSAIHYYEEQVAETTHAISNTTALPLKENNPDIAQQSKFSFRIDFYQNDPEGLLHGRIEHLATKEKQVFKGVDEPLLMGFIRHFLPTQQQVPPLPKPAMSTTLNPVEKRLDLFGGS